MTGRHSLNREVALSALNSPAGRSVAAAMAVGTMLGVALPSANADEGSANADLAPVTDLSADETITDTSAVKAPADANWQPATALLALLPPLLETLGPGEEALRLELLALQRQLQTAAAAGARVQLRLLD